MDKDFEKKVRMQKIRGLVVAVVLIAIGGYLLLDMNVEKADYGESLAKEVAKAEEVFDGQKSNVGNKKGQYAPYTLKTFEGQIAKAKRVSDNEESVYNEEKDAYEKLKAQRKAFVKRENKDVVTKEEAENLKKSKASLEEEVLFKGSENICYKIDGKNIKTPKDMNLMASEKGPYYGKITKLLEQLKLQGQVVSFYQDGSFGGKLKVTVPMYSEKKVKAYAYKLDIEKASMEFVSKAVIDVDNQTASFQVSEGGDYVVLTKKMHKDGQKDKLSIKDAADGKIDGDVAGNNGQGESFNVSIEIRCDTLANDPSKLEDESLKDYVPSNGTILSRTTVKVKDGDTVFDVLNRVCRDRNIHVKSEYTPMYGSYYVQGINYLYEFDGGQGSGWMYKVNGVFPNYGCSAYNLKSGDTIVWCYTCNYGEDVGGGAAV